LFALARGVPVSCTGTGIIVKKQPVMFARERNRTMKTATILGIALIMLGIVAFTYQGITYTTREKVIDLGPLQATVDKKETIPLTPLVGGLALVGGIILLIGGARRAS